MFQISFILSEMEDAMKRILCLMMVIAAVSLFGGYSSVGGDGESSHTAAAQIKFPQVVGESFFKHEPENFVMADESFSNLQLTEIDKPVYDKYEITEREAKGLPLNLPEIAPYREEKVAYLTFDDGPDDTVTPAILDILKAESVPATFFVLGTMVEQNPDVLKRIFNEGHAIGNHSYNHVYSELYRSPWNFADQFIKTDEVIKETIGVRPLIIRAPGGTAGVFNNDYWAMVDSCGYAEYDWNASTEDATASVPSASAQVDNIVKQLKDYQPNTLIVLMHSKAGKEETAKALPALIDLLRNKGYKFGVVTPMTPQPW